MNNVRAIRGLALTGLASLGLIAMAPAFAESSFQTGPGALTANARLDFRVIVPKFISFQVGSAGATVDLVEFNVAAANVGTGVDVARTNGGVVPVSLRGNGGNITLTGTTTGPLTAGPGENISFTEILSSSSDAGLAAPTLVDGAASAPITVTPNVGTRVVSRTANWTFTYDNTNTVGAGTYNGQVTYTAAMP